MVTTKRVENAVFAMQEDTLIAQLVHEPIRRSSETFKRRTVSSVSLCSNSAVRERSGSVSQCIGLA